MVKLIIWVIRLLAMAALGYGLYHVIHFKFDSLKTSDLFPKSYITMAEREKQLNCLAKNIYFEAVGESFEGKVAVAQVTLNRAKSGKFPNDICQVVYQKSVIDEKMVCQFSWHCENGPVIKSKERYVESMEVAKKVLLEDFRLPSLNRALYFHADYIKNPKWGKPVVAKIGRHIFYGDKT